MFAENGLFIRAFPCLSLYTWVVEVLAVQVLLLLSYIPYTKSCLHCIVSHVGNELSLGKDSCQAMCMQKVTTADFWSLAGILRHFSNSNDKYYLSTLIILENLLTFLRKVLP